MTKENKKLIEKIGIEVGNIFQLGHYYTNLMKDSVFTDSEGKKKPFYMGCYGIGIGRTMATLVEKYYDDKGIVWPESVAPYTIHLVGLDTKEPSVKSKTEAVYRALTEKNITVLYDDRENVSAGQKFTDADLIGIPIRLVVSKKTGENIEYKRRNEDKITLMSVEDILHNT